MSVSIVWQNHSMWSSQIFQHHEIQSQGAWRVLKEPPSTCGIGYKSKLLFTAKLTRLLQSEFKLATVWIRRWLGFYKHATRHSGVVVPSSGWLRNDSNRNCLTNFTHRNISIWMQACSLSRSAFSLGRCCKGWGKYKGFLYFFSWSSEQVGLTRITEQTDAREMY